MTKEKPMGVKTYKVQLVPSNSTGSIQRSKEQVYTKKGMNASKSIEIISESSLSSRPVSEARRDGRNEGHISINNESNEVRRENRFLLKTIISLREHEE